MFVRIGLYWNGAVFENLMRDMFKVRVLGKNMRIGRCYK